MSTGNERSVWTFSQSFTTGFRATHSELEKRLEHVSTCPASDAIQTLSADIAKLSKTLADAAESLPSYDQKLYEMQVSTLETGLNALRAVAAPKPKFSFKRKSATVANPVTPSKPNKSNLVSTTSELPHSNPLISSHTYAYLTTASLIGSPPTSCLTVSDLDYCVLNLLPTTGASELEVSAIHLRKISNSVLLLPLVDGSILAHDLSRCVVVAGCHQFRMHASIKVDVFLSIVSNPIVEDCHGIRFTSYPQTLLAPERSGEGIQPSAAQDFSHIRNTPSPNWIYLDDSETQRPWPTKLLESTLEVERSLREVLPA